MRLAWFTPLPPMASGISDYSSELVPLVAERAHVDLFCPRRGVLRRPRGPRGIRVLDPEEHLRGPHRYDATYYHLGNNPFHEFVYEAARKLPGIAVFHDAVLHHLLAHLTVERGGDPARYEAILVAEHGQLGTRLARLRRLGLATDFEKFLFPLTRHVARRSLGVVVHSEDSAVRLREAAPEVPVAVIPHHAGRPPGQVAAVTREEARERLRLPRDAFLVGHFGFITRPKQPAALIGGFARLHAEFPEARLLLVGADRTGGGLSRLIAEHRLEDAVRLVGYVDLPRFYLHLKAVDAVVNLRYPSAGESSGTFARALAEGRAVIANNYASFAEVPDDVALKVEIDRPQAEQVGEHLLRLARDPALRRALEGRARTYAREVLGPERCRDLYLSFARELATRGEPGGPATRRSPVGPADTLRAHRGARPILDRAGAEALPPEGNAAYVDLLYRLLLRRPAEEEAIRGAHASLSAGELTRADLAERMLSGREFAEVRLIEDTLRRLRESPSPFTVREGEPFAPDTTERAVEIPWMLSRWRGERRVLDVGYAFASAVYLTALLSLPIPSLHGTDLTRAPVPFMHRVAADVRRLPYRDGVFDLIYCISTLEHIGRDNTRYGLPIEREDRDADRRTLLELARILAPGGRLLVSVPFGRLEDHGWLLQYDHEAWARLVARTPFEPEEQEQFELTGEGWVPVDDPRAMSLLSYGDGVPGARGVLCAALVKRG